MNRGAAPFRLSPSLATIGLLICGLALPVRATALDQIYRFRPGIRTSRHHPFTNRQLQALLEGLGLCTGFAEMKFDETGRLDLGDRTRINGGSETARRLMIAAVDSSDSFILENRYQSSTVAFAQIADTDDYVDADGNKHSVWQVSLDFFDFTVVRGERRALAAFDPTLNLFHELAHGVLRLNDPQDSSDSLGDCERHLNLIRAELGLPERETYFPRQRLASLVANGPQVLLAEFIFVQKNPRTGKQNDLYLTFDMARVCDLEISQARSGYSRKTVP